MKRNETALECLFYISQRQQHFPERNVPYRYCTRGKHDIKREIEIENNCQNVVR